jgi:peptidoglycan/xylan/chitin deacetylase (PgdA/CDA1 family)/CelD/BcsL family acetyltransferase involved in cellulose biosynthesis
MRIAELRRESELRELKPAWEAVFRESASANTFLSWEWASAWWSAYGKPGALRILTASDDDGVIRGIAPMYLERARRYGQAVDTLRFVGDGSNDSDYLDFLIARGFERSVLEAFRAHWSGELKRGTALVLREMPRTSPNLPELAGLASGLLWKESETPCGTVALPETWDAYLGMLKPRFRTKVRSVLRNLEGREEVAFGFAQSQEEVEALLPVLFDLHTRRWNQDGKPGVFGWREKREFYHAVSALLFERGWLRFSWLKWKDRVIACQYGFVHGPVYYQLQEGYEPASEHYNAGAGLRAWTIREFLAQGVREYDFMGGVGRHKTDWGASVKQSANVVAARPTLANTIFARGPEWEERAKEAIKRVVPERLLALRRAGGGRPSAAAGVAGQASTGAEQGAAPAGAEQASVARAEQGGWIRRAAAKCYFHSGLPSVVRPFRERYRIDSAGGGRWSRRTGPSARILYFHRVNDDNDPFFPAMSTSLFEREMRYLAKHYKVVTLPELRRHLDSGSTETALAITFDDGYQDNYHNALPLLRRYGLPATIFLTTGSIDTREPLWFESLALALKNTRLDHLDLELDIPTRFWLRTAAERLDANGRLGQFFRFLPDEERRGRLDEVVALLAPEDADGRRDKMLTWDQVRGMKKQGIDFGGHTVTHPFLSKTTPERALWEVSECKRRIEAELDSPVDYFAYPNGREEDFAGWSADVLRRAGYQAALTTVWGVNYPSTDPMALRRGQPWEEDPAVFAYKLDWYELVSA